MKIFSEKFNISQLISIFLVIASLSWLGFLLFQSIQQQGLQAFIPESTWWLLLASFLLLTSLSFYAINFYLFLDAASQTSVSFILAMRLHIVGQMVRYLPGRFWGLVYQINASKQDISAAAITRANIDLMLLALVGNMIVALIILGVYKYIAFWLACLVGATGLLFLIVIYLGGLTFFFNFFIRFLPERFIKIKKFFVVLSQSRLNKKQVVCIILIFLASWMLYLTAWYVLSKAFVLLNSDIILLLCVWYTLAWMIGFAAFFTPNGLGVREVSFVWMAAQAVDPGVLAFLAIFIRAWFMLSDVINGLFWNFIYETRNSATAPPAI